MKNEKFKSREINESLREQVEMNNRNFNKIRIIPFLLKNIKRQSSLVD